jgi:hypothetical protein
LIQAATPDPPTNGAVSNISNTTNQTNNSTINNQTNNSTTINQANIIPSSNNSNIEPNNNLTPNNSQTMNSTTRSNLIIQPISSKEESVGNTISDAFDSIGTGVSYAMTFGQVFPAAFLFMRFINFWSICSLYLLPDLVLPTYLYNILFTIYSNINTSVFGLLNINVSVDT